MQFVYMLLCCCFTAVYFFREILSKYLDNKIIQHWISLKPCNKKSVFVGISCVSLNISSGVMAQVSETSCTLLAVLKQHRLFVSLNFIDSFHLLRLGINSCHPDISRIFWPNVITAPNIRQHIEYAKSRPIILTQFCIGISISIMNYIKATTEDLSPRRMNAFTNPTNSHDGRYCSTGNPCNSTIVACGRKRTFDNPTELEFVVSGFYLIHVSKCHLV